MEKLMKGSRVKYHQVRYFALNIFSEYFIFLSEYFRQNILTEYVVFFKKKKQPKANKIQTTNKKKLTQKLPNSMINSVCKYCYGHDH